MFGTRVVDILTLLINWYTAFEGLLTPGLNHRLATHGFGAACGPSALVPVTFGDDGELT